MIKVEVVRTEGALEGLREVWASLLATMSRPAVFLTWEWITTWWRHYGHGSALNVLVAMDESGGVVGIAPLMLAKAEWGPLALRRLVFIGTGVVYPAHLDFLIRPDAREAVSRAIVSFLADHRRDWDLLELVSIAETSPMHGPLRQAKGHFSQGYTMPCPYVALPADWDMYLEQNMSRSERKSMANERRRIEKDFPNQVVFKKVADTVLLSQALVTLRDLHVRHWGSRGQTTPFQSEQYVAFHTDMATQALERDWLRFYLLCVGEAVIAVNYCFRYCDVLYGYQRAYSEDWKKYSPGQLLMTHVIRTAIDEGTRELDMLHGVEGGKSAWGGTARFDDRIRFSQSLKGNLLQSSAALFDDAVTASRKYLPAHVRQRASRLVPRLQW